MTKFFHTVGIVGYPRHSHALITHEMLFYWLNKKGHRVIIEHQIANNLALHKVADTGSLAEIGRQADLAIVIGGNGNMLGAARVLAHYDIKVIGINHGTLGFLTDLDLKDSSLLKLNNILDGHFYSEKRFLLEVKIFRKNVCTRWSSAINEVVLHSRKIAHMIEFEVYIDNVFAFSQRSDGLIISTPTGSTAYSLSAGGPILTPLVDAIALIAMFPHTLSSRPLVINGNSLIQLKFPKLTSNLEISCDSQIGLLVQDGEEVFIRRSDYYLDLIHPNDYNYFSILSSKLGWLKKFI
ncbi:NAD(+) kinase [Sodalis sp. CWE]|uniref:NAD(+) kinase n=1 Tax=Sodalis sp. CWE TaxID=2803816 RepID=UPI001C7E0C73|nr:NAD(+) kinase [Sodalis sp. CWE]MBX4181130.1 NAD(+) kinase [Sodalis sp. CWE]